MTAEKDELVKLEATKYLELLIKPLVILDESISITAQIDALGLNLVISCDESDIPRLLGVQGQNITFLRQIMKRWGFKNKAKINIYLPPTKDRVSMVGTRQEFSEATTK